MKDKAEARRTFYSEDKQIARFQQQLMSNTKWWAFFLAAVDLGLDHSEWKYVSSDHLETKRIPRQHDLHESRFADGYFQPHEYKYIQWIFVPSSYKPYPGVGLVREQDVDGLIETLDRTSKEFPYEVDEHGLTIYGYK